MIIYNKWFVPAGHSAITLGPIIFIKPRYKNDEGLIAHEKHHQKQQKYGLNLPWFFLYLFSKSFRYEQELEAFRIELSYGKLDPHRAAVWLSEDYGLDISYEKALRDLISH